jgi:adenylosuccinate lyase
MNKKKEEGKDNDLVQRIRNTPYFKPIWNDLDQLLDPSSFVGRAPEQVTEFLTEEVEPVLGKYKGQLDGEVELKI